MELGVVREPKRPRGLVVRPTYGVKIRKRIAEFIEQKCLALWCLQDDDFHKSVKVVDDSRPLHFDPCRLAYATFATDVITLNASTMVQMKQEWVDFICLHEIEHLRRNSLDEIKVNWWALQLGRRLGLNVETAYQNIAAIYTDRVKYTAPKERTS